MAIIAELVVNNYNIITESKVAEIIVVIDSRASPVDKYNRLLNSSSFFPFYTSNKILLYSLRSTSLLLSLTTYFYIFFRSLEIEVIPVLDRS